MVPATAMSGAYGGINRLKSLPYIFKTSKKMSCYQRVGCLLDVTENNTL